MVWKCVKPTTITTTTTTTTTITTNSKQQEQEKLGFVLNKKGNKVDLMSE